MHDLFVYLLSMVIVIPLFKRLGLGAVVGYLIAGALIGPFGFHLLQSDNDFASEIAEFGIVMMLLLIGLELKPKEIWKMRGPIFGLGSLQVVATTIIFAGASFLFGRSLETSIAVGMILSISSTAIVLQTLQERGYAKSLGGERVLAVLLFQDMAIIPILAILPLLGGTSNDPSESRVMKAELVIGSVVAIILIGRFLVRPLFKTIARLKLRETFTALALLVVVGAAALMHAVGLSPALGAFLAGVILADSEFKHQIEADIEPFKGILMGLFFITVGANIDLNVIAANPGSIVIWVLALVGVKAIFLYGLGRLVKLRPPESLLFGVALAQGGEFAFVLIGQTGGLINPELAQIIIASVAVSMALAPILISLTIDHGMSRLDCVTPGVERLPDVVDESEKDNPVMVIGIGRFGQTLIRFLRANGYASTVLDIDSEQIEIMAKFGIKSYFGDGTNPDLLRAAGLDRAKVLVIAVDEPETTIRIVETLRPQYPTLPIYARAFDRIHAYRLLQLGVQEIAIETSGSAVVLGTDVLQELGISKERAESKAKLFAFNNRRSIRDLAKRYHEDDMETFIQASKQMSEQLEAILKSDPEELLRGASSDWSPPENVI
jgi:monovalent cation:proton antiporter-2 (CPA2) family protein